MKKVIALTAILEAMTILAATPAGQLRPGTNAPVSSFRVVQTYPHDRDAFTQGLEYLDGFLYEGTGWEGRSSIRKVELTTGKVLRRRDVPRKHFGEGITIWKAQIIELTWHSEVAFVYDRDTFQPRGSFKYSGEGWGLTHDATNLIMSDGTSELRVLDPATFKERRRIRVTDAGRPVTQLNELEYIKGQIFANVWTTDRIARIDPQSGLVLGWLDLTGLLPATEHLDGNAVLNGIAYDAAGDRIFVTGKLWPKLFEIKLGR